MPRRELAGGLSQARARMWRGMRMMREGFAIGDLIALADVPRKTAEKFVRPLHRAGYLTAEGEGAARHYFLVRDTGPFPPRVNEKGLVLDINQEIEHERERHAALLAEIRQCEERLRRFGAYVETFDPSV